MKIIREKIILISLATINPRQTLQFVINLKVFIKFHLASHFGLYLKKELKCFKIYFTVLLIFLRSKIYLGNRGFFTN